VVCCDYVAREGLPATPTLVTSLPAETGFGVTATALLNGQLFVTRTGLSQVSVYNTISFQLMRTITNAGFSTWLNGLATSVIDNYLYVGDAVVVHRVDLSVTSTANIVTWTVTGTPSGLSITSENTVLVVINNNAINEYTPSGSLVRIITTMSFSYLWQAVQVNNSVRAFTAYAPMNQICTASTTSTVIKCFGSTAGPGLALAMNFPRGMAIDTRGYMLVADSGNNRIILVDPTLTSARQLQLPVNLALYYPWTVSYNQSIGRLFVGEWGGQCRVLVFDGIWW